MAPNRRKKTHKQKLKSSKERQRGGQTDRCLFIQMLDGEGLGNQMFIYAAALRIKKKKNISICLIPSKVNPHSSNDYTTLFDSEVIREGNARLSRKNTAKSVLANNQTNFSKKISNSNIIENNGGNVKLPLTLYQNYENVQPILAEFKEMLIRNEFSKDKYKKFDTSIQSDESAFMHIRRGDYVERGWNQPETYYFNALQKLEANIAIKRIYILSNDLEWCKTQLESWKAHTTKEIIVYEEAADELETLYTMILCKAGAIISGSTFSSWGAMLGADFNSSSTIVYPRIVPQNPEKVNPFSFPSRWVPL